MSYEKNYDCEIIRQRLTDDSYAYAVQVHFGVGKRITLQTETEADATDLLSVLSKVCWVEDKEC